MFPHPPYACQDRAFVLYYGKRPETGEQIPEVSIQMESLYIALDTVLPLFLMMALGYIIRLTGLLNDTSTRQVNKTIFNVFLPLLVFINVYDSPIFNFNSNLMLFAVAGVLVQFLIGLVLVLLTEQENSRRGVMLQGMFRSNFVLYGIPIGTALFGSSAGGTASVLIAAIIPLFNILAVLALEMFHGQRPNLWRVIKGILTNPLILASAAGIACGWFHFSLPDVVYRAVSTLGGIATPLAFVILGASLNFTEIGRCARPLLFTLTMKLLIFPLVALLTAILIGYRGAELAVLLTLFASPIAVSSFTMAQQLGGNEQLAGQLVIFSSVLSIGTLFLLIWGLKYFAFF